MTSRNTRYILYMDYLHFEDDAGEHIEVKFQGIGEREKRKETIKKQGFGSFVCSLTTILTCQKKHSDFGKKNLCGQITLYFCLAI